MRRAQSAAASSKVFGFQFLSVSVSSSEFVINWLLRARHRALLCAGWESPGLFVIQRFNGSFSFAAKLHRPGAPLGPRELLGERFFSVSHLKPLWDPTKQHLAVVQGLAGPNRSIFQGSTHGPPSDLKVWDPSPAGIRTLVLPAGSSSTIPTRLVSSPNETVRSLGGVHEPLLLPSGGVGPTHTGTRLYWGTSVANPQAHGTRRAPIGHSPTALVYKADLTPPTPGSHDPIR